MKVVGIVSEYNPFHNGHKYQIDLAKSELSATHTVAVMSGNFVMRGEPAVFDKSKRARAAVRSGIDLVIELPLPYALSSAEFFAKGAVGILNSLNIIDYLSFGSESGDINILEDVAKELLKKPTEDKIKKNIKTGVPIFKAIEQSIGSEFKEVLKKPNNILGVYYLKALFSLDSGIKPHTIKRHKTDYLSLKPHDEFASATLIRQLMKSGGEYERFVPANAYEIYKNLKPVFEDDLLKPLVYSLRIKEKEDFLKYSDVSEGLNNLIYRAAKDYYDIEDIIFNIKSKRYSYTRIRRMIYNSFLDIDKKWRSTPPKYAKVLAFNKKGQELLAVLREKSSIPVMTNIRRKAFNEYEMLKQDYKAAKIYAIACENKVSKGGFLTEKL